MKKRSEETQTLRAGVRRKAEPKISPRRRPLLSPKWPILCRCRLSSGTLNPSIPYRRRPPWS